MSKEMFFNLILKNTHGSDKSKYLLSGTGDTKQKTKKTSKLVKSSS